LNANIFVNRKPPFVIKSNFVWITDSPTHTKGGGDGDGRQAETGFPSRAWCRSRRARPVFSRRRPHDQRGTQRREGDAPRGAHWSESAAATRDPTDGI